MKASKNIFEWKGRILLRMKNKGMIMAIGTPEITGGEEKYGANSPRPIRKGNFQESFDLDHRPIEF
jgi:hypothetical protein